MQNTLIIHKAVCGVHFPSVKSHGLHIFFFFFFLNVSGYLQLEHFKFSMNSKHCSEYKTEKHMHVCKSIYFTEVHKSVSFLFVFVFVLITAQ